jgi:hypothetical protein
MKKRFAASAVLLAFLTFLWPVFAQEEISVSASTPEAADGLDLAAVGQLFKDSENLEAFEKALNDSTVGVNNLDLDGNGTVDFIRVIEETAEGVHLIILQVPLAENEFQDVATIEVEKAGEDQTNMQVHGNDILYGPDFYVTVSDAHIHRWPIIALIYRPVYRPYRSVFYFGHYPHWWRPRVPLAVHVYRGRTVKIVGRNAFTVVKTTRVTSVTRVHYIPRSSIRVVNRVKVVRPAVKPAPARKADKPAEKNRRERVRRR